MIRWFSFPFECSRSHVRSSATSYQWRIKMISVISLVRRLAIKGAKYWHLLLYPCGHGLHREWDIRNDQYNLQEVVSRSTINKLILTDWVSCCLWLITFCHCVASPAPHPYIFISFIQGNSNCETIEFEGNEIGQKPSVHFGDVFSRNAYITEIVSLMLLS